MPYAFMNTIYNSGAFGYIAALSKD